VGQLAVPEGYYVDAFIAITFRALPLHALQTSPQLHQRGVNIVCLLLLLNIRFCSIAVKCNRSDSGMQIMQVVIRSDQE
jgi:hypothetical protein